MPGATGSFLLLLVRYLSYLVTSSATRLPRRWQHRLRETLDRRQARRWTTSGAKGGFRDRFLSGWTLKQCMEVEHVELKLLVED